MEGMNTETIRELLKTTPFQPFVVLMSNGFSHEVLHPEFAMLLKSNLVIGEHDSDKVWICPLLHIAVIETQQQTA
jgi:hypothetical protein